MNHCKSNWVQLSKVLNNVLMNYSMKQRIYFFLTLVCFFIFFTFSFQYQVFCINELSWITETQKLTFFLSVTFHLFFLWLIVYLSPTIDGKIQTLTRIITNTMLLRSLISGSITAEPTDLVAATLEQFYSIFDAHFTGYYYYLFLFNIIIFLLQILPSHLSILLW